MRNLFIGLAFVLLVLSLVASCGTLIQKQQDGVRGFRHYESSGVVGSDRIPAQALYLMPALLFCLGPAWIGYRTYLEEKSRVSVVLMVGGIALAIFYVFVQYW
ncbi:MAG: hypothetical protein M5U13_16470 [Thermoanaerobaculia bacterium]|nr:hypothetical protein [Thermoanaerobaculia bacterium]